MRIVRMFLVSTCLVLAVPACAVGADSDEAANEDDENEQAAGGDSGGDGPISVTDADGNEITLDRPAERVVCLDGSCLDGLAEVSVTPVATTNPGMASHEAFFGPDAEFDTIGGSFLEPAVEDVLAAEPDLIIGTRGVHAEIAPLVSDAAPIYLQAITDLDAAVAFTTDVGVMTGREDEAAKAVASFEAKIEAYSQAVSGDRVPLSLYGSDLDFGIDAADSIVGRALAEVTAYPWPEAGEGASGFLDFSVERVLDVDPDAIFVQTFTFDPDTEPLSEQLQANALWGELTAVQEGRVYEVDTSYWASGRTTRTLGLVLDTVIPALYPDDVPEPLGD